MVDHIVGPWFVVHVDGCEDRISGKPNGGAPWIAEVYGGFPKGVEEANARLIATAPDLLNACKETLGEMRTYNGESEFDDSCPMKPTFDQLKAAIAKAEGKEAKDV